MYQGQYIHKKAQNAAPTRDQNHSWEFNLPNWGHCQGRKAQH